MEVITSKRISGFLARRRAYFKDARSDIDALNMSASLIIGVSTFASFVLYAAFALGTDSIRSFSVYELAAVPVLFVSATVSCVLYRKGANNHASALSVLVASSVFVSAILIDVLSGAENTGALMPLACVALPAVFILPASRGSLLMLASSVIYLFASAMLKSPESAEQDLFRLVFALGCAVVVREIVMRCRVRHFETGMQYRKSSVLDSLSSLYNRTGAFDAIARLVEKAGPDASCVLAVLDIDDFKVINDKQGHLAGDEAIRRMGAALKNAAKGDSVVGRFGGDEFVIFLSEGGEAELRRMLDTARRELTLSAGKDGGKSPLGFSVGAVASVGHCIDPIEAFAQADRALYVAKECGKNRMVVIPYAFGDDSCRYREDAVHAKRYLYRFADEDSGMCEAVSPGGEVSDCRADRFYENAIDQVYDEKVNSGGGCPEESSCNNDVPDSAADDALGADGLTHTANEDVAHTVLIVDDEEINRAILGNLLADLYEVEEAENGRDALSKLLSNPRKYCAVLLDVLMDEMDGLQTLGCLYRTGLTEVLPILIITSDANDTITRRAYELGAMDVIGKPVVPYVVRRRVESVAELFRSRTRLSHMVKGQREELVKQTERIVDLTRGIVEALSTSIEFRDADSGDHVHRIYGITKLMLLLTDLGDGLSNEEIDSISLAAIMHDVGKIAIPDSILNKNGKLTPEEFEIMKTHTVQGEKLLSSIPQLRSSKVFEYALDIARHHHERWDGSGYPDGLSGSEISNWAQVVALADVYDALTNERRYKAAYSHETAMRMILEGECGAFNPDILKRFSDIAPNIAELNTVTKNEEAK